ncbi:MAG TPA: T9SS type A sorting domain-containing protein, partial [Candidatus Krumholzibacteria bacterium]|nr:T9SS type A sorting domain-containing protein [Candidatus Krumholzibacteria bacterium]
LKIENITGPVTVEIYNLEGELVHSQTAVTPGEVVWDLTTKRGFLVGSGKYLVRITGPNGSVVRTVAVLR